MYGFLNSPHFATPPPVTPGVFGTNSAGVFGFGGNRGLNPMASRSPSPTLMLQEHNSATLPRFENPKDWQEHVQRTASQQIRSSSIFLLAPTVEKAAKALIQRINSHHLGTSVFQQEQDVNFPLFRYEYLAGGRHSINV